MMSSIQQNYLIPKLDQDDTFRAQFYSTTSIEPDYNFLPTRNKFMRRSFHFDCPNGKLKVSECVDDTQITLSINDAEVTLNYDLFNELCSLKYTLNINQGSF